MGKSNEENCFSLVETVCLTLSPSGAVVQDIEFVKT
jgi:hypothetical protein